MQEAPRVIIIYRRKDEELRRTWRWPKIYRGLFHRRDGGVAGDTRISPIRLEKRLAGRPSPRPAFGRRDNPARRGKFSGQSAESWGRARLYK
jgi:hypothetical protein